MTQRSTARGTHSGDAAAEKPHGRCRYCGSMMTRKMSQSRVSEYRLAVEPVDLCSRCGWIESAGRSWTRATG
jgi:rRNA maturation endonuclease Nob1